MARAIVIAFLVVGLLVSGLLMGRWLTGGLEKETFGPAFALPGLGIGFVGAGAAAAVGLHSIAELFLGIGIAAWVLISSVALNRIYFRPRLAPSLIPTLTIEMAPAAAAGNAYFIIHPGPPDLLLLGLSGYAGPMVEDPAGSSAYAWVLVAAITVLVGAIAARTIVAGARRALLPSPGGTPAVGLSRTQVASQPAGRPA